MVQQVVSQATRQQALRQQRQVRQQLENLQRQQRQTQTARSLRGRTRSGLVTARKKQKTLQSQQKQLTSKRKSLVAISKLPTKQEFLQQARAKFKSDKRQAEKAIDKGVSIRLLPSSVRKIAERITAGKKIKFKEGEFVEKGSFKGPVPEGFSEVTFRETGETKKLFKGPVQPGVSERTFRETGKTKELFVGPVPEFESAEVFRETGKRFDLRPTSKEIRAGLSVQPFVTPTINERVRVNLLAKANKIINKGFELGRNAVEIKKDVDSEVSKNLKKLGLTDKRIEEFNKSFSTIDIIKTKTVPGALASKLDKRGAFGKLSKFEGSVRAGVVKGIRDEPTTIALSAGVGRVFPPIVKFLGGLKAVKSLGNLTPTILKKAVPNTLLAAYTLESGLDIKGAQKGQRGEEVGKKVVTEVVPFILGTNRAAQGELRSSIRKELSEQLARLSPEKQVAFKDFLKRADLITKTKTTVRNVDLSRLETVPDKAKPVILKYLKDNDVVIGGSLAQQTGAQVKRSLAQSDLDLYSEVKDVRVLARNLAKRLQDLGIERVQILGKKKGVKPKVDFAAVYVEGNKVAEFHNIRRLIANIASVTPAWRNPNAFIVRTPSGIRVPKISVQIKRKLVGGFTDPKRSKDLKDFKDLSEQLFKRAELAARQKFFFREKSIRKLEEAFDVKISRKPVIGSFKKGDVLAKLSSVKKAGGVKGVKLSSKEPPIISRSKVKANKPFNRTPSKEPFGGSKPSKPSKPKAKKPSQVTVSQRPSQKPSQFITPSQFGTPSRPSQRPIPSRPSQLPIKSVKKFPPPFSGTPSQPPVKTPPSQPPVKTPPSQPPVGTSKSPPPFTPSRAPSKALRPTPPGKPPKKELRKKPRKLVPVRKKQPGYFTFYKRAGKFRKINRLPVTFQQARDLGAQVADRSIANTFKFKRVNRKAQRPNLAISKGYFKSTENKFRNFKIRKGKQIPLKNKFIEKRGRARLDTPTEIKKLQAEAYISRLRRQRTKFIKKPKFKRL